MLSDEEVERRLPVWEAMADLFLDTDYLGIAGPERVAARFRPAGYSPPELRRIFVSEVLPAFAFNLFEMAGEWAGWHPDFVRERVLDIISRRPLKARVEGAFFRRAMLREWLKIERCL